MPIVISESSAPTGYFLSAHSPGLKILRCLNHQHRALRCFSDTTTEGPEGNNITEYQGFQCSGLPGSSCRTSRRPPSSCSACLRLRVLRFRAEAFGRGVCGSGGLAGSRSGKGWATDCRGLNDLKRVSSRISCKVSFRDL